MLLLDDTGVSQSVIVHAPSATPTLLGSMQFQGHATSTLPVGSLRACGGERLAALQPSSAAHGVQPPASSRSVPMHQVLLPQLMGLLAISKLHDKHSTNGESEGMGRGVPSGALTLVGGAWHSATSTLCDGVSKRLMPRGLALTPGLHKLQRLGA